MKPFMRVSWFFTFCFFKFNLYRYVEALRETAEQAGSECAQRQEQMATALSAIRNFWNSLAIPMLEQMSFNDTDLGLLSLSKVMSNFAALEKLAEQRSMQRDHLVVSLTEAWRILKARKEVQERILKAHIGLKPQVLASLQAELNKVGLYKLNPVDP